MKQKTQYRVRNWAAYNAALVNRGNLTLWVDEEALHAWPYTGPKQRGAQYVYAEAAIQCVLTLRAVYHLALRAAQGWAQSVFTLLQVRLPVPTYSTLSRRGALSEVELARLPSSGPVHLVLDASGFKVYGEGEWKVRQHGWGKRRAWRELHLAVDEATGEIMAAVAREAGVTDADVVPDFVGPVDRPIHQVSADGAYDKRKGYEALETTGARVTIPPRRDAKIRVGLSSAQPGGDSHLSAQDALWGGTAVAQFCPTGNGTLSPCTCIESHDPPSTPSEGS
jgi:hypothetical protein